MNEIYDRKGNVLKKGDRIYTRDWNHGIGDYVLSRQSYIITELYTGNVVADGMDLDPKDVVKVK